MTRQAREAAPGAACTPSRCAEEIAIDVMHHAMYTLAFEWLRNRSAAR